MNLNIQNVLFSISLMEGAEKLNMGSFQSGGEIVEDLESFHKCGNTACFVGYLAMTPLWKDFFKNVYGDDARLTYDGRVEKNSSCQNNYSEVVSWDEDSLASFLGISQRRAMGFIYGYEGFYKPVQFQDVKPKHVIKKLNELLDEVGYERT